MIVDRERKLCLIDETSGWHFTTAGALGTAILVQNQRHMCSTFVNKYKLLKAAINSTR